MQCLDSQRFHDILEICFGNVILYGVIEYRSDKLRQLHVAKRIIIWTTSGDKFYGLWVMSDVRQTETGMVKHRQFLEKGRNYQKEDHSLHSKSAICDLMNDWSASEISFRRSLKLIDFLTTILSPHFPMDCNRDYSSHLSTARDNHATYSSGLLIEVN